MGRRQFQHEPQALTVLCGWPSGSCRLQEERELLPTKEGVPKRFLAFGAAWGVAGAPGGGGRGNVGYLRIYGFMGEAGREGEGWTRIRRPQSEAKVVLRISLFTNYVVSNKRNQVTLTAAPERRREHVLR